jgi:vacuolar-type H+-ATPase subunit I/STV1
MVRKFQKKQQQNTRRNEMTALEKIEKLEQDVTTLSKQLLDLQSAVTKVFPIVDGLVAVVGRVPVLEAAQKALDEARDQQIKQTTEDLEKQVSEGKAVEDTESRDASILFVEEKETSKDTAVIRILPVGLVNESERAKFVGLKVGDSVPANEGFEVKVTRIFTQAPVDAASAGQE